MTTLALTLPNSPRIASAGVSRFNARFDAKVAAQLNFLTHALGMSVSDVLRQSVETMYRQHTAAQAQPFGFLAKHIGAYAGSDPHGSENYKSMLAEGWAQKHGLQDRAAADAPHSTASRVFEVRDGDGLSYPGIPPAKAQVVEKPVQRLVQTSLSKPVGKRVGMPMRKPKAARKAAP